jgi:hypothetical protein
MEPGRHETSAWTSDLEPYVAIRCAGSFEVGANGELLIYPSTWKRAYVVRDAGTWRRLRLVNALLMPAGSFMSGLVGFLLLASGVAPGRVGLVVAAGVLLSGAIVFGVAGWVSVRFDRSSEVLTRDEARRITESVQRGRLSGTLLVGVLGIGVLGASVVAVLFSAVTTAVALALAAALITAYSARRLLRRRPLIDHQPG